MSAIWYRADGTSLRISAVKVDSFNDSEVWVISPDGMSHRRRRVGVGYMYFPTFIKAREYALARANNRLAALDQKRRIQQNAITALNVLTIQEVALGDGE